MANARRAPLSAVEMSRRARAAMLAETARPHEHNTRRTPDAPPERPALDALIDAALAGQAALFERPAADRPVMPRPTPEVALTLSGAPGSGKRILMLLLGDVLRAYGIRVERGPAGHPRRSLPAALRHLRERGLTVRLITVTEESP